jgi:2-polyprenyl-3-methyl-5-hydroxy-6-metoxy-1,4-benzoquinol methylase
MEPQTTKPINVSKDTAWLDRDIKRFKDIGWVIPKQQIQIYNAISKYIVGGRTVIDIGSSIGVGTNILSHEARFVWGIDVNSEAIAFAKQMFKRPNLDFEVVDLENMPERPFSKFEIFVMSEVIEHLSDPNKALNTIKERFCTEKTVGFITAPNINNDKVQKADANNPLHNYHWTAGEFYEFLIQHFKSVTLYGSDHLVRWNQDETVDGNSEDRIIIARVEGLL